MEKEVINNERKIEVLGVQLNPIRKRFNNTDYTTYQDYEIINKEVKKDDKDNI